MRTLQCAIPLCLAVFLLGVAGCTSLPREVMVTQADAGTTVEIAVGGTLNVTLPSNPSTGYAWEATQFDREILQLQGPASYSPSPGSEGLVGAEGHESFLFKAVGAGQTVLKMNYARSFEPEKPADSFEITVAAR